MDKLFYFPREKTLCWIAGYSTDTNTSSVEVIIKSLSENAKRFADVANIDVSKVQTALIEKSSRYKYMRVFYAEVDPESAPKEAYVFQNPDWTMWKWIQD